MIAEVKAMVLGRGEAALGCIEVQRARDGSRDHYHSLEWVPPWRPRLWARHQLNHARHVAESVRVARSEGVECRIWIERPGHPVPRLRARRRSA